MSLFCHLIFSLKWTRKCEFLTWGRLMSNSRLLLPARSNFPVISKLISTNFISTEWEKNVLYGAYIWSPIFFLALKASIGNFWTEVEWYYDWPELSSPTIFSLLSRLVLTNLSFRWREKIVLNVVHTLLILEKNFFVFILWKKKKRKENSWPEVE